MLIFPTVPQMLLPGHALSPSLWAPAIFCPDLLPLIRLPHQIFALDFCLCHGLSPALDIRMRFLLLLELLPLYLVTGTVSCQTHLLGARSLQIPSALLSTKADAETGLGEAVVQGPWWCHTGGGDTREGQEQGNAKTLHYAFRRAEHGHGYSSVKLPYMITS